MVGYLELIKQRVSRVSRSKPKFEACAFFLRTSLAMAESNSKVGDHGKRNVRLQTEVRNRRSLQVPKSNQAGVLI